MLEGQAAARQKALVGSRLIATQVYNLLAETPLPESKYLPLPAVDAPAATAPLAVNGETAAEFRARLAAQNAQTLAERAGRPPA